MLISCSIENELKEKNENRLGDLHTNKVNQIMKTKSRHLLELDLHMKITSEKIEHCYV